MAAVARHIAESHPKHKSKDNGWEWGGYRHEASGQCNSRNKQ
jgi:hypothetical protein